MAVPLIEQVRIQAQVLVPLVRALQSELGEERANALVRKAIGPIYQQTGEALDYQVVKQTPDTFDVNVTGCRYAKFYQELGEPELGFLLTCSADYSLAEGFAGVELTRTQTIMQGADHCDFRFKLK
jgi:predicted ArsR family transcriptional regulator